MKKASKKGKKRIAVFANGWNSENLSYCMEGLREGIKDINADTYVFLGHDAYGFDDALNESEACVYKLPRMSDFDGVVFVASGMDFPKINEEILSRCHEAGVPVINIGGKAEGTVSIYTDNYQGMKPLADHLIEVHGVRDILFIAGPKDNQDSNDRLRAVIDSCREHDVPFGEENIRYFNWDVYMATDHIRNSYAKGEKLPDVIMCANDNTAFFISFVLEDIGIRTPEDVLITGFDGTNKAKTFFPSMTSVQQPFKGMGLMAAECLKSVFDSKPVQDEYCILCEFMIGESCGCDTLKESDARRRELCRSTPKNAVMAEFRAGRIHFMEHAVLKSERYSTLGACLREFFYARDGQEGNPFYIFIDPALGKLGECEPDDLPAFTLTDSYDLLVGKDGEFHYDEMKWNLKDGLLPDGGADGKNHIYVFMPLYIETFICGFMVMADDIEYFERTIYSSFKASLNQILETYRKNLKLTALNDRLSELINRDPMTLVKNRAAYEHYREELNEALQNGDRPEVAFVMFDINDLKYINDTYGHEKGDEYIRNSCNLICSTYVHSPIFRIGGDEFLAILKGKDFKNRNRLLASFQKKVADAVNNGSCPEEKVSVASGMAVLDGRFDHSLDMAMKRADDEMYKNKRIMKSEDR